MVPWISSLELMANTTPLKRGAWRGHQHYATPQRLTSRSLESLAIVTAGIAPYTLARHYDIRLVAPASP